MSPVINPISIIGQISCIINGILVVIPINNPLSKLCHTSTTSVAHASTSSSIRTTSSTSASVTVTLSGTTLPSSLSSVLSTTSTSSVASSTSSPVVTSSTSVPSTSSPAVTTSVSTPTSTSTSSSDTTTTSASSSSSSAPTSSSTQATTSSSSTSSAPASATYNAFMCPADGPLSCQNTTAVANTCCFNAPGGSLLQTQFWDTNPATGPDNSWTIHGLWPDNCDGTYQQYCDDSRDYTNITQILQSFGRQDLLDYMNTYWTSNSGSAESFWEHEFGKHATCISTLDPSCYSNYQPGEEAVDFFNRTVSLFQSLPTYDWLAAAGIVPSTTVTYTLQQIEDALASHRSNHQVYLGCTSGGVLDEVWYFFNVQGSVQDGTFVAVDPLTSSSCPSTGIQYLPKGSAASTSTATTATATSAIPSSSSTAAPFTGSGYLYVSQSAGSTTGFVITDGSWYNNGGTPATIKTNTTTGTGPFTISTSKGLCAVAADTNAFTCGAAVTTGSAFTANGNNLVYAGSDQFGATAVPSGTTHGQILAGSGNPVNINLVWRGK